MLFGWFLDVDEVHAFSPQTFITPWKRFIYRDKRWKDQIDKLNGQYRSGRYKDLKGYQRKIQKTKTHIYWDITARLDNLHVKRLWHSKIVKVGFKEGGHNLIRSLKESGELDDLLRNVLRSPDRSLTGLCL